MGLGLTGKLGRAWVVHGMVMVHGFGVSINHIIYANPKPQHVYALFRVVYSEKNPSAKLCSAKIRGALIFTLN